MSALWLVLVQLNVHTWRLFTKRSHFVMVADRQNISLHLVNRNYHAAACKYADSSRTDGKRESTREQAISLCTGGIPLQLHCAVGPWSGLFTCQRWGRAELQQIEIEMTDLCYRRVAVLRGAIDVGLIKMQYAKVRFRCHSYRPPTIRLCKNVYRNRSI